MSQITMTILEADRRIHGQPHGSFADYVVAALSVDPETIEELEAGLVRFIGREDRNPFAAAARRRPPRSPQLRAGVRRAADEQRQRNQTLGNRSE